MYVIKKVSGKGKVLASLESRSLAVCKLWCLQNTTGKSRSTVTDDSGFGLVVYEVEGQGKNVFPKVIDHTKIA